VKVASQGSDFVLAWQDGGVRPGLRSARIDATGAIATAASYVWEQDVAFHGTSLRAAPGGGYWLVYADDAGADDDLRLLRLDATGAATDASPQTLLTTFAGQSYPDVAFDASGAAMVVYQDSSTFSIHGLTVNEGAGGALVVGAATRMSPGGSESGARVVYDGSHFRVGWISSAPGDPTPQAAMVVAPTLTTPSALASGPVSGLRFARNAFSIDAVWAAHDGMSHGIDIFRASSTMSSGYFSRTARVSGSMYDQNGPRIANNGTRSLLAWVRPTVGGARLYAARVNGLGEFQDSTPIAVSSEEDGVRLRGVYSNGTGFLILWDKGTARRTGWISYSSRFTVVDDSGTVSTTSHCGSEPADIRPVRASYVMMYPSAFGIDFRSYYQVLGATLNSSGCTEVSEYRTEDPGISSPIDLATTSGATYLVSRSQKLNVIPPPMRPGSSRTLTEIAGAPTGLAGIDALPATGGDVIAYATDSVSATVGVLFVDREGDVVWNRELQTGIARNPNPQIAASLDGYFVLWTGADGAILGQRVSATGALMDASPVMIAGANEFQLLGDAVTDPIGRCIVTYSAASADSGYAYRAHTVAIDFRFSAGAAPGASCSTGFGCASGYCVDGVCCGTACGYSNAQDCQVCSVAAGAATDGTCAVVSGGTECRAAAGECDVAELCDGTSGDCPADAVEAADIACGEPSAGACDLADHCDGVSPACRVRGLVAAGTTCRESRGGCDAEDVCDGLGVDCADGFAGAGRTCRSTAGICDVVEACDGLTDVCPADAMKSASFTCRPASGDCDVPENCDGVSPACPADALADTDTVCRSQAGPCDVDETCSGTSRACPPDEFAGTDEVCRPAAGGCDVPELCAGGAQCPGDVVADDGSVCGPVATCGTLTCRSGACVEVPRRCPPGTTCDPTLGCVSPPAGCGCRVHAGNTTPPPWAVAVFAWLAWRRRRR